MIIRNHIFPLPGFAAMNVFGLILVRKAEWDEYDEWVKSVVLNHERIHTRQMIETLFIGFYLIYLIEWIFKGYDNISFEKEAYYNEFNQDYLKTRKIFSQWRKLS